MNKSNVLLCLFVGFLLLTPIVYAQTESKIYYSGFDRFIDNVKMIFTFGDEKVIFALDIREKELNSAIENNKNGNTEVVIKNLQRARERLQFIQEKVSVDIAEEVKLNVNEVIENINTEENLLKNFEVYILEEKKTQLIAELVIEVEGKKRQTEIRIIENQLGKINNEIKEWVVENSVEETRDDGLTWEIKTDIASGNYGGDDGLTWEIKEYVAGDGTDKNEPLPESDLNQINPDLVTVDTTTNNIDNPGIEENINSVIEGTVDIATIDSSTNTGTNDITGAGSPDSSPGTINE